MKEKKDIVKSIVVLFVICLVVSAALAVVNSFTAPVSAANATERENEARRAVIPDAAEFKAVDAALPDGVVSAYEGVDAGGATPLPWRARALTGRSASCAPSARTARSCT